MDLTGISLGTDIPEMVSMRLAYDDAGGSRSSLMTALGVFLVVGAVYIATGSGRIDIIDGQYRFDVAHNLVDDRSVQVRDPFLSDAAQGIDGVYSPYGISGSLVALPLVALGRLGPPSIDREQFFFSFTSALLGAGTAAILFLFYVELGIARPAALFWTAVASFATLSFPAATTTFDQTQHGFFVIVACFAAVLGARRDSMRFVIAGGAALAVLVNFQETYAILFPTLGLATVRPWASPEDRRRSIERFVVFVFVGRLGLLCWALFNNFRFGSFLFSGKGQNHPSPFGNPVVGLAGLLVSPGKSIFLYSPPTALALFGLRGLIARERILGFAVAASSLAYLALMSVLSFYGGDWCWGPRYFVVILPLLALAFPFTTFSRPSERVVSRSLIAAGLVVQLLAISVDHHRFFYERSLPRFFWYSDRAFYFRHSSLFARPMEIWESLHEGVPAEADAFRPGPYSNRLTYAVFGGWAHTDVRPPQWMRYYRVFWLPRPWPLWLATVPKPERPVNLEVAYVTVLVMAVSGTLALRAGRGPTNLRPLQSAKT
jgi:hypothetical protein